MKRTTLILTVGLFVTAVTAPVLGEINCNQVRRYAQTGRSAEDISETMIIPLDQVKKCLESEEQTPNPTPQAK